MAVRSQLSVDLFIRNVPLHVRDQFKSVCARRRSNMTREIIDFMRRFVDEQNRHLLEGGNYEEGSEGNAGNAVDTR